jgi:hypothetical protein
LSIFETFSKRETKMRQTPPDVFIYDKLPRGLRVQITNIWTDLLGNRQMFVGRRPYPNPVYRKLHDVISDELGMEALGKPGDTSIAEFFIESASLEQARDMMQIVPLFALHGHLNGLLQWRERFKARVKLYEAIRDMNTRLMEHGMGYGFVEDGVPLLIRKDNEHLHREAVIPALTLLHEQSFEGANEEYRRAQALAR